MSTDVHSVTTRSFNMSRIRDKNTEPETSLRHWLWHQGYRYRLHTKELPGRPDIVFAKQKKIIFVHGCFWHKHDCRYFRWPKTNAEFWRKKILENVARDQNHCSVIATSGWRFLVVWECELRTHQLKSTIDKVSAFLHET